MGKMKIKPVVIALSLLFAATLSMNSYAESISIPTVPINVVDNNKLSSQSVVTNTTSGKARIKTDYEAKKPEQYPLTIEVKPGVNEIITIAKGLLNRLVLPFTDPKIQTSNKVDVKIRDNVAYITSNATKPVGMFITDISDQTNAISLTLVPRQIPPREIRLQYQDPSLMVSNKKSSTWEKNTAFEVTVRNLMRTIALREKPPGYALVTKVDKKDFKCTQNGIASELRHIVKGHDLEVGVRLMENVSNRRIELKETNCYDYGVMAVAAWPTVILEPGEATEMFIVRKRHVVKKPFRTRFDRPGVTKPGHLAVKKTRPT
jgi:conjugal transfer pilus assembly protein TraK